MKFTKHFTALLALLAFIVFTAPASAQVTPTTLTAFTNLPATMPTASFSNLTSSLELTGSKGVAVQWRFNASAGLSNATLTLTATADGTNYSPLLTITKAAEGTTNVTVSTNLSADALAGYRRIGVGRMSNAGDSGVLTNKGVILSTQN